MIDLHTDEHNGVRVVTVIGELDTFATRRFTERLAALRGADGVVVDLAELAFVDSAGLHALFAVGRSWREVGARVVFVVPAASPIRRVVELVHLADVSPVCETLETALARLAEPRLGADPLG